MDYHILQWAGRGHGIKDEHKGSGQHASVPSTPMVQVRISLKSTVLFCKLFRKEWKYTKNKAGLVHFSNNPNTN